MCEKQTWEENWGVDLSMDMRSQNKSGKAKGHWKGNLKACSLESSWGFLGDASGKEPACQCRRHKR